MTRLLCFVTVLAVSAAHAQDRIAPGQEGPLPVPGFEVPCTLFVPSDWKPGRKHPMILMMHGQGGTPMTFPWPQITEGREFLVVGLTFASQSKKSAGGVVNGIQSDPASCREMVEFIATVRGLVDATYGVDREQVFLAGLSMGGWGVSFYGFHPAARDAYRGYAILAAGPVRHETVDFAVTRGRPVLILNGENDQNLAAANAGRPELEAVGAEVTQVVIPGHGHVPPLEVARPALSSWLRDIRSREARARDLAAMGWREHGVVGQCRPGVPRPEALGRLLAAQDFVKETDAAKPLLVLFHRATGAAPTDTDAGRPAKESAAVLRDVFSWPEAVGPPAASRHFDCVLVDVGERSRRDDAALNLDAIPMVVLLGTDREVATVLIRGRIREAPVTAGMRSLLGEEARAAMDTRIAETAPYAKEMKGLRAKRATLERALETLGKTRSPGARFRKKQEEIEALDARLEALDRLLRS